MPSRFSKSASIAIALLGCSMLTTPAAALPDGFADKADALLEKSYSDDGPGAVVVVTENGEVVYRGQQGLADIESERPITADTVFRFASITKQFTAAVILQLADEGQLSLDDPLSKYVPDYPGEGAKATVRQLLNHTSGIRSYTGIPGLLSPENTRRALTTEELVATFKDAPMQFAPGERFAYNNSGYVLLGAVIEKVTGKSWDQAIVDRISKPLGLSSIASFENEADLPDMALGYTAPAADGTVRSAQPIHAQIPHAAGALRGNAADLAGWADALHGGDVVSPDFYAQMIAPTVLKDGSTRSYGYGLVPGTLRGTKAIGHGGGIFGFATESIYLPEHGIFVAVLTNSDFPQTDPRVVIRRVAAMAMDDAFPEFSRQNIDPDSVKSLFGVYRINDTDTRQFFARDGKFYSLRSGGSESEVFAASDNRFFFGPNSLSWMQFTKDAAGKPVMQMHQNGAKDAEIATYEGPIPETEKVVLSAEQLAMYVGKYTSPIGPFVVALDENGVLTGKLGGQPPLALTPRSDVEFSVQGVDATVTFKTEGDVTTGLEIAQGGQTIPAEKVAMSD